MSKRDEFLTQVREVEKQIVELEHLREDLYFRIDEEEEKLEATKPEPIQNGMYLSDEQLHKLLSLIDHTIIPDEENFSEQSTRKNLLSFREELSWSIADNLGCDLNEGTVDPSDFKFKKSGEMD